MCVMILVPILAPRGQLKWTKPPDVDARIPSFFLLTKVRQAVHQALEMERIDQPHRSHPEEAHPAKSQNQSDEDREHDNWGFRPAPDFVNPTGHFWSPALLVSWFRLIQPAQVRPPETALLRARDIFRQIGYCVMQPVI